MKGEERMSEEKELGDSICYYCGGLGGSHEEDCALDDHEGEDGWEEEVE